MPPSPTPSGNPSIAVLPFANLSDEPGRDAFTDGMVEEIATALTRCRALFVVAGGSGLALKGQGLTPQEAGRLLGVRYLLDGAVDRAGDHVRISVSLIDAADGVQLWADAFDGAMADIFGLLADVALGAAARIEPQVQAEEMRRAPARPAPDPEAYDLFLRARALTSSFSREPPSRRCPSTNAASSWIPAMRARSSAARRPSPSWLPTAAPTRIGYAPWPTSVCRLR